MYDAGNPRPLTTGRVLHLEATDEINTAAFYTTFTSIITSRTFQPLHRQVYRLFVSPTAMSTYVRRELCPEHSNRYTLARQRSTHDHDGEEVLDPCGPRVPQEAVEGKDHQQEGERPEGLLGKQRKTRQVAGDREQRAGAGHSMRKKSMCARTHGHNSSRLSENMATPTGDWGQAPDELSLLL